MLMTSRALVVNMASEATGETAARPSGATLQWLRMENSLIFLRKVGTKYFAGRHHLMNFSSFVVGCCGTSLLPLEWSLLRQLRKIA